MPELRWILLVAGIVLIGVVYAVSRQSRREGGVSEAHRQAPSLSDSAEREAPSEAAERQEPQLADRVAEAAPAEDAPAPPPPKKRAPNLERPAHEQKIVTLRVAARGGARFAGEPLVEALRGEGLEHGQFKIFHRHADDNHDSDAVFSVASMVEPGHFDLDNLTAIETPGISLFMLLPGPKSGVDAFADMLSTARRLADTLEGDVLDEVGSTLSRQAESHVREEIVNYEHRLATLRSS
ncbi:MAG: cell division protein ZipA [Pseudomonadota bacterium]